MKRMMICLLAAALVLIGIASEAQARYYFKFVNQTQSNIQIGFHVGFFCKDHKSGAIAPGGTWSCNSNCGAEAIIDAYALTPKKKRIAFGSIIKVGGIGHCPLGCRLYVVSIYDGYNRIQCACE